ncbi:MAG: 4-hydroxyphenylpyruvate dioxygenase [Elainella sp.]
MNIDHVHFYVEDAQRWQAWFVQKLGFHVLFRQISADTTTISLGYSPIRPLTSLNGRSWGRPVIQFRLSSPNSARSPVAAYLNQHPPSVADLAFQVADLDQVLHRAKRLGVEVLHAGPTSQTDDQSQRMVTIRGWGDLQHTLVETASLPKSSLPEVSLSEVSLPEVSLSDMLLSTATAAPGFSGIDHVVLNIAQGDLERAICWYEDLFGFQRHQNFTIQTERSALCSQVLRHPQGTVQMPINEPASPTSQIQEFLDWNRGAGIQHIALRTHQILPLMAQMRQQGVNFLSVPATYYEELACRPGLPLSRIEQQQIAEQEVLADWQANNTQALLLQTFTQPIFEQPTFFFELIERRSYWLDHQPQVAEGFGEGNFRALFEAIEREQIKRGSLQC